MKTSSATVKATILATMLLTGQAMAQGLPDEINHPQYLKIYQNLEQILNQKTAEYNKLADEKAEIEKNIQQLEAEQVSIPARNAELTRMIAQNKAEISRIDSEISRIESDLGVIAQDIKKLDNLIAQLTAEINNEMNRNSQIQRSRDQVANDLYQIEDRLQREVNEENQSIRVLERMNGELNGSLHRRKEIERELFEMGRDVERFRRDIVQSKKIVAQDTVTLSAKKPLLADVEAKLSTLKSQLATEQQQLASIDSGLNPKRTRLNKMKADLAGINTEVNRLEAENSDLTKKIAANEAKIASLDVGVMTNQRSELEAQIEVLKGKIDANQAKEVELKAKIAATSEQIKDLRAKVIEATRNRDTNEVKRLQGEIAQLESSSNADKAELLRLNKETDALARNAQSKRVQIVSINNNIAHAQKQIETLTALIATQRSKIAENGQRIQTQSQASAQLSRSIPGLEAEVKELEASRLPLITRINNLEQQLKQTSLQVTTLKNEVQALEANIQNTNIRIVEMEKFITDYPQNSRRLEAHLRQLDEKVRELSFQIDREERLLDRIRQNRVAIQLERDRSIQIINQLDSDIAASENAIANLQSNLNQQSRTREELLRENQESFKRIDGLKTSKISLLNEINSANEEIKINESDLVIIARDLPKFKEALSEVIPFVNAAEKQRQIAATNASNAQSQYQSRLSLYQTYLSQAQKMGEERAKIGSTDGAKVGAIDAKTVANKFATENANLEAKWDALRRGYVRGEVSGFNEGFNIGLSSTADANRGIEEGSLAGARRAKDQADLVIKPEKYLEEMERRLREDETNPGRSVGVNSSLQSMIIKSELSNLKAMTIESRNNGIPALSAKEIADSDKIITSLDNLINQSKVELDDVLKLRLKLADAKNVYTKPAQGENANNVNCSDVYKGVKEFSEACKGSYVIRYQSLFNSAHEEIFKKEYGLLFKEQVGKIFESELNRLYPVYMQEALAVAKESGISSGQREIYQQSFGRSEKASYSEALPKETARVERESKEMVQQHLNRNAVLAMKSKARIISKDAFGIAPGNEIDLRLLMKNIGSVASSGNSLVKITSLTNNLSFESVESPLASVPGRTHVDLTALKFKVRDEALPGTKVGLVGEIVHPGNQYRSSRVEKFQVESVLAVNPSIESSAQYEKTPKVALLFGLRNLALDFTLSPKFSGVDSGYEVTLEEVGTKFMRLLSVPAKTEVLGRKKAKTVKFIYEISKAARGKTLTFKLTVKNNGAEVMTQNLEIKPQ